VSWGGMGLLANKKPLTNRPQELREKKAARTARKKNKNNSRHKKTPLNGGAIKK